ncbi:SDR family oxidoreductase [Paenibacillus sp. N4]|nr:SDR family NAD(P)-dependent oxidoreductase [Paenibacillus vietnamensis]MCA0755824.1 SDR family oxidoreductase [Paenibacillus vietnamensis]
MSWGSKVVIVTGAGGGIGRAVARRFAEAGAQVIVVGRTSGKVEDVAGEIRSSGYRAVAMAADVSSEADVTRVIQETITSYGRIDVMVNNAAVCPQVRLTDMSLDEWNGVITNNLTSIFLFCRGVIPFMLEQGGGVIVNVSSVHALATLDGYSAYAASKAGIVGLTRAIALDYAKQNIRANTVLPGAVHTSMLENSVRNLTTPNGSMELFTADRPRRAAGRNRGSRDVRCKSRKFVYDGYDIGSRWRYDSRIISLFILQLAGPCFCAWACFIIYIFVNNDVK